MSGLPLQSVLQAFKFATHNIAVVFAGVRALTLVARGPLVKVQVECQLPALVKDITMQARIKIAGQPADVTFLSAAPVADVSISRAP